MQKNKDFFSLFDASFNSIHNFYQSYLAYTLIMALNLILYAPTLYGLINHNFIQSYYEYFQLVQFCLLGFIIAFIIFFVISYCKNFLTSIRNYFYLILQAMAILYFDISFSCFGQKGWGQNQPINQILSALTLIIYLIVIGSLRIFFYYPYIEVTNFMSMKINYFGFYMLLYKLFLSFSANFYLLDNVSKNCCFLITIVFFGLKNRRTHCNQYVARLWAATNMFVDWTIVIVFILPYTELLAVNGKPIIDDSQKVFWYVWAYTTPFIVALSIIEMNVESNWEDLFKCSTHEIQSEILHQKVSNLKILIAKLRKSQLKTNSQQFKKLWQLIILHHKVCQQIYCPLQNLRNYQIERNNEFQQQKRLNKTLQFCLEFGKNYLENQINQNPTDLRLGIQMANYQFQAMHNKQAGLVLFNQFYNKGKDLSLQNKYALFYLKKKIQMLYLQNESENGYANKSNAESQIQQFRHNIEVSVAMLGQFWYFLADPKCNLKKLYDLANVLFPLKIRVDKDWQKIEKLKNIESYHLYAKYLIKMFNDKEKGLKILDKASMIEQELRNREEVQLDLQNSNIVPEENGIVFLEFDGVNSGVMYQVNLAAQKMFGYNKGQLLDRKVNDIMPKIFAQYHDRILEHYQQTNKAIMMNKQRAIIGKSKDGYLFPITIIIKPVKNLYSQTSDVYASIKRQLWVKQVGYIFLDIDENISEISASLLAIFPILQGRNLTKKKVHVTEIMTEYQQIKQICLDRKQSYEFTVKRTYQIKQLKQVQEDITFSVHIEPISIAIAGRIGYSIKMSRLYANGTKTQANTFSIQQETPISDFGFCFKFYEGLQGGVSQNKSKVQQNLITFGYEGGMMPRTKSKNKNIFEQSNLESLFLSSFQQSHLKKIKQQAIKKNYAEGIKTKRLQNRAFRQIHDDDQEIQFDIANNHEQENQEMTFSKIVIRPSELSLILSKDASNKYVLILKIISFLLLLVSSSLCVGQYLYKMFSSKDIIGGIEELKQITEIHSEVIYMKMLIAQYILFKAPSPMTQWTSQIQELDSYLHENSFSQKIQIKYSDKSTQNIFLNFALNKLVSEANSLKSLAGTKLKLNSSNVFFINYNSINGLSVGLQSKQEKFLDNSSSKYQTIRVVLYVFLAFAFCIFLIGLIAKNILLNILLKKKSQILQIFFEIPRKSCQTIQKQCQKFIQKLSLEQENVSMDSAISEDDLLQSKSKTRQKQKKRNVIGQEKTTKHFLLATFVFLIILLIYQTVAIIFTQSNKEQYEIETKSIFNAFKLQSRLTTLINSMNSHLLDPTMPILQSTDSISKIQSLNNISDKLVKELSIDFFNLLKLYDSTYMTNYNAIMYESLCNNSTSGCYEQYGQKTGLNSIFYNYLNQINLKYNKIIQINTTNLLQQPQITKQQQIQKLMKKYWRQLCTIVQDGFTRQMNIEDTIFFSIMIAICVLNFTVLMIGWWKFYQSLQSKIVATEYILTFIPIDEINKNPKIANYIKTQILDNR